MSVADRVLGRYLREETSRFQHGRLGVLGEPAFEHGSAGLSAMADWLLSLTGGQEQQGGDEQCHDAALVMPHWFLPVMLSPEARGSEEATVRGASPAPSRAELLQFFRLIDRRADHMRGLIADLLDQGRIEAGTLSGSPEPAAVAGLVDQAWSTFLSGGGRHALHLNPSADLPRVMAGPERIVQVLNDLLEEEARGEGRG